MSRELTNLQIEIIKNVFKNVDVAAFIRRAKNGELSESEIEESCHALNEEFLLHGIDEEFEATDYGKEVENLLDIINRPRLR